MLDLVILGAGPAGLTAAIYGARAGLDFVVIEQDGYGGGQIVSSHEVENYPGVSRISGSELGERIRAQAVELGAEIRFGIVEKVEKNEEGFLVVLEEDDPLETRSVIVATGAVPKKLGVPGEEEYQGAGISYCAICDGAFYKDKEVLVVGGGDTAVEDALYLSSICSSVTIALRRNVFRGAARRVELLKQKDNVEILYNTRVKEIFGDGEEFVGVSLDVAGEEEDRGYDGMFVAVGVDPASHCLEDLFLTREDGYIVAGENCASDIPGLYVAGDIRKKPLRQVITAAADGANAVMDLVEWLRD